MSVGLLIPFAQEPTTFSLNVMNNQPFPVPKSTVCLPVYAFTLSEVMQIGNQLFGFDKALC
jgi:hypothetical protein